MTTRDQVIGGFMGLQRARPRGSNPRHPRRARRPPPTQRPSSSRHGPRPHRFRPGDRRRRSSSYPGWPTSPPARRMGTSAPTPRGVLVSHRGPAGPAPAPAVHLPPGVPRVVSATRGRPAALFALGVSHRAPACRLVSATAARPARAGASPGGAEKAKGPRGDRRPWCPPPTQPGTGAGATAEKGEGLRLYSRPSKPRQRLLSTELPCSTIGHGRA